MLFLRANSLRENDERSSGRIARASSGGTRLDNWRLLTIGAPYGFFQCPKDAPPPLFLSGAFGRYLGPECTVFLSIGAATPDRANARRCGRDLRTILRCRGSLPRSCGRR